VAISGEYDDLTNKPSIPSAYTLPTATASVLGGVKIGSGISIDGNGVISASAGYTLPNATTSTLGGVIVGTGLSVAGGTVSVSYGSSSSTACVGNDARLSDARTPLSHTHSASDLTSGTVAAARLPLPTLTQSLNGTDNVLATPYSVVRQLKNWKLVNLPENQRDITVSASTGIVTVDIILLTPNNSFSTANATAVYRGWSFDASQYYTPSGQNAGSASNNWTWTKPLAFSFRVACGPVFPTTGIARVQFGKKLVTSLGTLDQHGIGIEIRGNIANTNGRLWILRSNGTTLTSTDTGLNIACAPFYDILLTSDGAGNVTCWVNDTAYTTSGGPTTDLLNATSGSGINIEATNGNTSGSSAVFRVSRHIWVTAQ
jgi:hypothetical protein